MKIIQKILQAFCVVIVIAAIIVGFAIDSQYKRNRHKSEARREFEAEAIEHGAASYVCDPQTGETTFRWKDVK